jgi:hypothetical protein
MASGDLLLTDTELLYNRALDCCRKIFLDKTRDYGTAWRVLRPISIVDQIFIKGQRIRNIQEMSVRLISDTIETELQGIVNYAIIALIQKTLDTETPLDLPVEDAMDQYDRKAGEIRTLMKAKNHDYGEAWKLMNQKSFVDLILMKLIRIRQILHNGGKTLVSEGMEANFSDIANYALFSLIRLQENIFPADSGFPKDFSP